MFQANLSRSIEVVDFIKTVTLIKQTIVKRKDRLNFKFIGMIAMILNSRNIGHVNVLKNGYLVTRINDKSI